MRTALDEGRALLIQGNLSEDADRRADNQYVWDLWTLAQLGDGVPTEGLIHYVYGLISDGENRRLAQMNGGYVNDAGSQLVFAHPLPFFPNSRLPISPSRPGRRDAFLGKTSTWMTMRGFA